jgi:pimeloyl-ACP methyl ester carboxylesterase
MLFFLQHGYRVTVHDRRGHGRSAQVSEGNDMNLYADDLAELTERLDLHDAVHVGHSAGGGEVARCLGRHGESRVAKAVLISAVTPSVLQTDTNSAGVPQAASETCRHNWRRTARCSIEPYPQGRSTTSTNLGSNRRRPSLRTGGVKA